MVKSWLKFSDVKFLILSRGRSKSITSHKVFPFATLVVPESEKEDYQYLGMDMITTPDEIKGLSMLRNWCIHNFKEEIIVMADDDIEYCCRVDNVTYSKVEDPEIVRQLVFNTAQMAYDSGTFVFGFGQSQDVRKYDASEPFGLRGWVGGVIGVIGKENMFIDNMFKVDIDFCLEALLKRRIIWKDNRIAFAQIRDTNKGGNSIFRTKELVEQEKKKLQDKWGRYIKFRKTPSGEICSVQVKRRLPYTQIFEGDK